MEMLGTHENGIPGPCRTEFSDVGFDFIVVGTNKILGLMNSIVQNLIYLAFATTSVCGSSGSKKLIAPDTLKA